MIQYSHHIFHIPASDGMYGPSSDRPDIKRTVIRGTNVSRANAGDTAESSSVGSSIRISEINLQDRQLAGVLYSISADERGEIFPIYVGRNTIGSEETNDVYLSEDTVSPNHAVLLIRVIPDAEGRKVMTVSLTDYDSDFGTSVNGEKLGFESVPLYGQEIIKIGNAYTFLFLPLDSAAHNLHPSSDFLPLPRKKAAPSSQSNAASQAIPSSEEIFPTAVKEEDEYTFYGRSYAKKEDHSINKTIL